jgi:uncharacterized membrane protein
MARIEKKTKIKAPPSEIFKLLEDINNWPRFMPNIKESKLVSEGPYGAGSLVHFVADYFGVREEWTSRVTDFKKNEVIAWESIEGVKTKGGWWLKPLPDGTTGVTFAIEYEIPGNIAGKLFDRLIVSDKAEQNVEAALESLKREVFVRKESRILLKKTDEMVRHIKDLIDKTKIPTGTRYDRYLEALGNCKIQIHTEREDLFIIISEEIQQFSEGTLPESDLEVWMSEENLIKLLECKSEIEAGILLHSLLKTGDIKVEAKNELWQELVQDEVMRWLILHMFEDRYIIQGICDVRSRKCLYIDEERG